MDKISNSEGTQDISLESYFERCKDKAKTLNKSHLLPTHRVEDSYKNLDLNQENLEDQKSKEIFDDLTEIFPETLTSDFTVHRDDNELVTKVYGKNNFCFEPLMDFKPLKHQQKKSSRKSSSYLTLASQLFRHISLVSQGELLDDSENEQSVSQNLELLRFMKNHQPFEDKENEKLLRNNKIFKYYWLLKKVASSEGLKNEGTLIRMLMKIFQFCRDYLEIPKKSDVYGIIWEFPSPINSSKFQNEVTIENYFAKVHQTCQDLHLKLEEKLKLMNKTSFYYLKKHLEALYNLAGPGRNSQNNIEEDKDAIKYFGKEFLDTLEKMSKDSKHEPWFLRYFEEDFTEAKKNFQSLEGGGDSKFFDPWKFWTSSLVCYYGYLKGITISLIEKLSICYDYASKKFLETLLQHPSSFFMSKDVLDINWNLLDRLISLYEKYFHQSKQAAQKLAKNDPDKELSEMNILCANLYVSFEVTDENDSKSNFVALKSIYSNETINSTPSKILNSNESFIKSISSKLGDQIDILIGKAILDTKQKENVKFMEYFEKAVAKARQEIQKREGKKISNLKISEIKRKIKKRRKQEIEEAKKVKLEITKIKQLGIDFYSTHHDLDLYKTIKEKIGSEMNKLPRSFIEQFKGNFNEMWKYNFGYTVKEDDEEYETDDEFIANESECKERKKSLFNYHFLQEILSNQSASHLTEKTLPKEDDKFEGKIYEEKESPPQQAPGGLNKIQKQAKYDFNSQDFGEMGDNQPIYSAPRNQPSLNSKNDQEPKNEVTSFLSSKRLEMENSKFHVHSEISKAPSRLFSYCSQQSMDSC